MLRNTLGIEEVPYQEGILNRTAVQGALSGGIRYYGLKTETIFKVILNFS